MTTSQAIDQMRRVLRRQHKAFSTEKTYLFWLRRYIHALFQMPRHLSSEQKLERFLSELAQHRDVSASTQNQAFNAVLFFYREVLGQTLGNVDALRAQRPVHERHAPTVAETQSLLATIGNEGGYPTNLIARLLYGCGLRLTEPLNLRIKDINLERRTLCIRGAKGGQDRVVASPASLIPELTQQMQVARAVWERDQQNRTPLMLPHRLARKYPAYQFSWGWAWLFPAHHPCRDPWTGTIVRYRMHEVNVQRAVKKASRQLGISVLPHELRHGYATHCLERGTNPRAIQRAMGHKSLETTMGYFHAESLSVTSPLEAFAIPPQLFGNPSLNVPIPESQVSGVQVHCSHSSRQTRCTVKETTGGKDTNSPQTREPVPQGDTVQRESRRPQEALAIGSSSRLKEKDHAQHLKRAPRPLQAQSGASWSGEQQRALAQCVPSVNLRTSIPLHFACSSAETENADNRTQPSNILQRPEWPSTGQAPFFSCLPFTL